LTHDRTDPAFARRFSPDAVRELEELVARYPQRKAAMLPALWIAQREYGGEITAEAMEEVAHRLGVPPVEVEGVASFYTMYNLKKRGRKHIEVCACLTCAVLDSASVIHALEQRLGIKVGETTADGEYSLSEAECLNWCEAGTVVQVGHRYYGNVTAEDVDRLLDDIAGDPRNDVVTHADTVVRVQLRGGCKGRPRPSAEVEADRG